MSAWRRRLMDGRRIGLNNAHYRSVCRRSARSSVNRRRKGAAGPGPRRESTGEDRMGPARKPVDGTGAHAAPDDRPRKNRPRRGALMSAADVDRPGTDDGQLWIRRKKTTNLIGAIHPLLLPAQPNRAAADQRARLSGRTTNAR